MNRKKSRALTPLWNAGFHGDRYFLTLIDKIMPDINAFIETGANVGTTARYVARMYPHVMIHSCEPDSNAFKRAQKNLKDIPNVNLSQMLSPQFLYHLYEERPQLESSRTLYWLDAHGYGFRWPLHDEIAFITGETERGIIFIDDAQVPNHDQFKYCIYEDQTCNSIYIENALAPGKTYQILYPTYSKHTSPHHPLIGYVGIAFGSQCFPDYLPNFTVRNLPK